MKFTVSFGENIKQPDQFYRYRDVRELLQSMCYEKLQWEIADLRAAETVDEKKEIKATLPYVVASHFNPEKRSNSNFERSNGLILDLDHIDVDKYFNILSKESLVHFMFRSPSGDGLKIGIMFDKYITDSDIYSLVYRKCAESFQRHYKIDTDHTSDAARACFLSADEDFYFNEKPSLWTPIYDEPKRYEAKEFEGETDLEELAKLCKNTYVSAYHDWVKCGIALNTLGEDGRELFKLLSLGKGTKDTPEQIDRKFDSFDSCERVGIGTFYYIIRQYGGEK